MEVERICPKCGELYYAKVAGYCVVCRKAYNSDYRKKYRDTPSKRPKKLPKPRVRIEWGAWGTRREYKSRWMREYRSNPETKVKEAARNTVYKAVLAGRLQRPTELNCIVCNQSADEWHHHLGYDEEHWLDVVAICTKCHYQIHH